MIREKHMGKCFGLMDPFIKVNGKMVFKMEKVSYICPVAKLWVGSFRIAFWFRLLPQRFKNNQTIMKVKINNTTALSPEGYLQAGTGRFLKIKG
jgi:hypothetical protein